MEVDPSNVSGEKVEVHKVEWQVNVSHVMVGLGVAYVAWKFGPALVNSGSDGEDGRSRKEGLRE